MKIERLSSGSPWEESFGYCRALRSGDRIHIAGTTAVDSEGNTVAAGDVYGQSHFILTKIAGILSHFGAEMRDVIRTRIYLIDVVKWPEVGRAHAAFFAAHPPVATLIEVSQLIRPDFLVEIEAEASTG
jgi:enamine deaminase RidA (YjgF/YER057c/UK114 family)